METGEDPHSRLVVIIVFAHVRTSVPTFKTEQISSENNVRYWRDCGSGRVDHGNQRRIIFLFVWKLLSVYVQNTCNSTFQFSLLICMYQYKEIQIPLY